MSNEAVGVDAILTEVHVSFCVDALPLLPGKYELDLAASSPLGGPVRSPSARL